MRFIFRNKIELEILVLWHIIPSIRFNGGGSPVGASVEEPFKAPLSFTYGVYDHAVAIKFSIVKVMIEFRLYNLH
jgi:hypothetical protein